MPSSSYIAMKNMHIPQEVARKIALHAQCLNSNQPGLPGKEGLAQTIEHLGYVQIDTIAVIQRAHHHTLWTRCPEYTQDQLHDLQANDRRVFEYWAHAMAYLPMSDYRYYLPKMYNFRSSKRRSIQQRLEKCGHLMQPILERIRQEGPLSSKDFDPPPGQKVGTWWDWKPAKIALEMLFWRGELMVSERRNFQKVYDLTERVLPEGIDTRMPNAEEIGRFAVVRALTVFGLAREKEIQTYLHPEAARHGNGRATGAKLVSKSLKKLVDSGEVCCVHVDDAEQPEYYALPETLEHATRLPNPDAHQVFLLSPFDNLVIQRDRLKRLFGFMYTLECYLPAGKRKYGYFTLPILWGDRFVGRLDPKADRKQKTFIIRNLVFEPDFHDFDAFLPAFARKLQDFARFNDCDRITVEKVSTTNIKRNLKSLLKK